MGLGRLPRQQAVTVMPQCVSVSWLIGAKHRLCPTYKPDSDVPGLRWYGRGLEGGGVEHLHHLGTYLGTYLAY